METGCGIWLWANTHCIVPDPQPSLSVKALILCISDLVRTILCFADLSDLAARITNGDTRSRELPRHFKALATLLGCSYLNSREIVQPSLNDGIHLEPSEPLKLAEVIKGKIREMGLI